MTHMQRIKRAGGTFAKIAEDVIAGRVGIAKVMAFEFTGQAAEQFDYGTPGVARLDEQGVMVAELGKLVEGSFVFDGENASGAGGDDDGKAPTNPSGYTCHHTAYCTHCGSAMRAV